MDPTFGARLRLQRERQNVALATIADETKISVALLDGLERDDLSRWPGGLFRRAYVRTYAQKIGLNPEQVLREFLAVHPDPIEEASAVEAIVQNAQAKRPRTRIGLMLAGLAGRAQRPTIQRRTITPETFAVEDRAPMALHTDPLPEAAPPVEPGLELERDVPGTTLVVVPSLETNIDVRREARALERDVVSAARLCTRIACARDHRDLSNALEEMVGILDAQGAILWVWDPDRDSLFPVLAHGYPDELLARLPEVSRRADNAIASAFCCGQKQVVRGADDMTGAVVVPLVTPEGCAGVLALEFANGVEQHEVVHALATIVTAQLSTLFAPPHSIDEDWIQPDRSLVAS